MGTDWQVEIVEFDRTDDGARLFRVSIRHSAKSLALAGLVASYDAEHPFIDELESDALLPSSLVRRLLTKLHITYSTTIGDYGDSGLIAELDLHDFIHARYPPDDARFLKSMVDRLLRSFF